MISYKDSALVILPEGVLLQKGHNTNIEALAAGLDKYPSFAEHSNVAKAVDEALHAEKQGIDPA
jgi:hypothetical protein